MLKEKKELENIAVYCIDASNKKTATNCEVNVKNIISETINLRNKKIENSVMNRIERAFDVFLLSARRRHTRSSLVSWARRCVYEAATIESLPSFKNGVPADRGLKLAARLLNFIVSFLQDEKSKMKKQSRSVTKSP